MALELSREEVMGGLDKELAHKEHSDVIFAIIGDKKLTLRDMREEILAGGDFGEQAYQYWEAAYEGLRAGA